MDALRLTRPGEFVSCQLPEPATPQPGEALVQVHRVGVCGTDLHAYRGSHPLFTYPRIPGHELGVEVLALGSPHAELQVGDRCAVEPYLNCGTCIACRRGKPNCCIALEVLGVHVDGGFCERFIVPAHKLHRSTQLSYDQLALVETLCIGAHAVERALPQQGEQVLVIGAGPIGLTVMQFARLKGCEVIAIDLDENRLGFCREQLGVEHTVRAGEDDLGTIRDLTNGDLPTIVFDATGNKGSMERAFQFVAPGGQLVFVGLVLGDVAFSDADLHRREITLHASRNATPDDFRRVIGLLEAGHIDLTPWITHRATCRTAATEFPTWLDPQSQVVKAVIEF